MYGYKCTLLCSAKFFYTGWLIIPVAAYQIVVPPHLMLCAVKPVLVVFLSLGVSNFHIVECISIFFHPPLYPNSQFCVR